MFPRDTQTNQGVLGPFFLGILVNYLLWGVQVTQSYHYYTSFKRIDKTRVKAAVCLLFVVDAIQTICASKGAWRFIIELEGSSDVVEQSSGWGNSLTPIIDVLTASIVHCFYAQKIWRLLNPPYNYTWTAIVLSLSFFQVIAGFGVTVTLFTGHLNVRTFSRDKVWGSIWLITAALDDIIITVILTRKLSSSRTGYKDTDDLLSKLIRLIIETGLMTTVVQFADLVVYLRWPKTSYCVPFGFIVPKVYSNSMLALLNSRDPATGRLQKSRQEKSVGSIRFHKPQFSDWDDSLSRL